MYWFLRLFSQFANLESLYRESTTERLVLKGRADAESEARVKAEAALARIEQELADWKAQSAQKDAEIQRLNGLLIEEAHKVADTMSIHAIGKRVYSKAADQPPVDRPQPLPQMGRPFARQLQHQQIQHTRVELKKLWDELPSGTN